MVSCVVIGSGIRAADAFFSLAIVLALDGGACGVALFGDVGAVPEQAFGEVAVEFFRDPAEETVVDEFVNIRTLGNLDEAVFGVPLVGAEAIAEGVAIAVEGETAGRAAGDIDAPAMGGGVGRRGVVGGLDGESVGPRRDGGPSLVEVFRRRSGGGGLAIDFDFRGFVGGACD